MIHPTPFGAAVTPEKGEVEDEGDQPIKQSAANESGVYAVLGSFWFPAAHENSVHDKSGHRFMLIIPCMA